MNTKTIIKHVLNNMLLIAVILVVANLVCLIASDAQLGAAGFLNTVCSPNMSFLIHTMAITILFARAFPFIQHPLIVMRHKSYDHLYITSLRFALVSAVIYFAVKALLEILISIFLGSGEFFLQMGFDLALVYLTQFLAVLFAFLLLIMLFEIFHKVSTASIVFCSVMAIDFLCSKLPLFGTHFVDIDLFVRPMSYICDYTAVHFGFDVQGLPASLELIVTAIKVLFVMAVCPLIINKRRKVVA